MAFSFPALMVGVEFRGCTTKTSKKGKVFKTVRVESPEGRTAEISVTNEQYFPECDALVKGSVYDIPCYFVAMAPRDGQTWANSYISMNGAPMNHVGSADASWIGN